MAYGLLQRVYSEGVHFGGDHLDKRLLQEVLRQFVTENCAGDEYAYTQVEKLWKMLKYSSFESFRSSHKIHGMTREEEEEFKRLYYALEMMLLKLEKIKVKNTNSYRKNRGKVQTLNTIDLTMSIGSAPASLFPDLKKSPKGKMVSLSAEGQRRAVEDAMTDFLEQMDILMMRSGTRYSELYLLLFSGQGYQYPLIEQIVLEHMNRKREMQRFIRTMG